MHNKNRNLSEEGEAGDVGEKAKGVKRRKNEPDSGEVIEFN